MRYSFYDDPLYRKKQAEITRKYWKKGIFDFKIKPLEKRNCDEENIFCSKSCSAKIKNSKRVRIKKKRICILCLGDRNRSSKK